MESLLYRALDYGLSQGASYVEIRWQRDSGSVAVMRNSHLEYSARYVNEGIAVRVVAGGGLGFAATSRIDAEEV
ncbi:MAG: DNA gyrase modulator, partial [Pyrobaculum sp.]